MRKGVPALLSLCLITLVLPSGHATEDDAFEQGLATIEDLRGISLDRTAFVEVARTSFTLPPGVDSFTASVDWFTGELVVEPFATTAASAANGCSTPLAGWAVAPIGVGDDLSGCAYQAHAGSVETQTLACVATSFCFVDALNLPTFDISVLFCATNAAVVEFDWVTFAYDTDSVVWNGFCFVGFFGSAPPTYTFYDSLVYAYLTGLATGLNNHGVLANV